MFPSSLTHLHSPPFSGHTYTCRHVDCVLTLPCMLLSNAHTCALLHTQWGCWCACSTCLTSSSGPLTPHSAMPRPGTTQNEPWRLSRRCTGRQVSPFQKQHSQAFTTHSAIASVRCCGSVVLVPSKAKQTVNAEIRGDVGGSSVALRLQHCTGHPRGQSGVLCRMLVYVKPRTFASAALPQSGMHTTSATTPPQCWGASS